MGEYVHKQKQQVIIVTSSGGAAVMLSKLSCSLISTRPDMSAVIDSKKTRQFTFTCNEIQHSKDTNDTFRRIQNAVWQKGVAC